MKEIEFTGSSLDDLRAFPPSEGINKYLEMKKTAKLRFASVWDAIEDTPEQAESMKLRSRLMMAVQDRINREGLSQAQTAKTLGVTQPRISDLMRGRISLFSVESLIDMLMHLGMRVEIKVKQAA